MPHETADDIPFDTTVAGKGAQALFKVASPVGGNGGLPAFIPHAFFIADQNIHGLAIIPLKPGPADEMRIILTAESLQAEEVGNTALRKDGQDGSGTLKRLLARLMNFYDEFISRQMSKPQFVHVAPCLHHDDAWKLKRHERIGVHPGHGDGLSCHPA